MESPGVSILVDPQTGFVKRASYGDGNRVIKEIYLCSPLVFPGDVLLPGVVFHATYGGGRLTAVSIASITDARLNEGLPSSRFAVAVPAETNVFDFRETQSTPRHIPVEVAKEDVVDFVDGMSEARSVEASWGPWTIALIAALLAMLLLGECSRRVLSKGRSAAHWAR